MPSPLKNGCDDAGTAAAAFLDGQASGLQSSLMWTLTVLPPGSEDLALRALSALLARSHLDVLYTSATQQLTTFLREESTLAQAALRQGAWWQEVFYRP